MATGVAFVSSIYGMAAPGTSTKTLNNHVYAQRNVSKTYICLLIIQHLHEFPKCNERAFGRPGNLNEHGNIIAIDWTTLFLLICTKQYLLKILLFNFCIYFVYKFTHHSGNFVINSKFMEHV